MQKCFKKIGEISDKLIHWFSRLTSFLCVALVLNVAYDVFARYVLAQSSVALQELEWHLFAIIMLFGLSVTLKDNAHVRVDVIYERLSDKKKHAIDLFGFFIFLAPLCILIAMGAIPFVEDAYKYNEISEDPGGLHYRWVIKAVIPFSFFVLLLTAIRTIIKNKPKHSEPHV